MTAATATLLISCPDQIGLVAKIANFIYANGGNIIHADQHTDFSAGLFLMRIEWQLEGFNLPRGMIEPAFAAIAKPLQASWCLHFSDTVPRLAIWVTKQDHCLLDLLWRQQAGEIRAEIPLIISNHRELQSVANQFGIEFYHLPITAETKIEQEARQLELLREYRIDLVILAKYMQVLTPDFINFFPNIINIHHSFLPAFAGANPYQRAYDRGVKIIGATAHYITADLDQGPIIEQDVVRVSHRDTVGDLIRQGKDLERVVLARAVRLHLQNRVLVYANRTVVFA
ncbi:formyltetrahydrofolate deformylase [Microcystis aeruginosa]|jgi:formyltetrahydrofolate deformylase|uniref:Formyltetrahydrofolate deformylase n=2 Tax=Microcystis TaxID=1125 RepID=A0A552I9N2_MICVR|nr:formyltetrahydrofolate deformylase [Microcystis aeruginosa]TRU74640.1 MAG: formyltetrahydrofolate deformylase [Microcystis viridis Mv_BB_P_19951000_S68]TRU75562.1 MAG: formyltetrahydrofolate deformylase [Microcystis viridis Mv_BB_P_19951000_S69]TRU80169.1 MAG: formyltetrahydrofolate deformylase [Microcystis viridis Mv_BB_P_19951000_S68D]TRU85869.1 MAG: formyltetrahydrofolate deformylase [Microcystis viridis Mv_BB_P_19951000_S69D]MDB9420120.1 formyltetrahydrofolate deformylase [Microcystis a